MSMLLESQTSEKYLLNSNYVSHKLQTIKERCSILRNQHTTKEKKTKRIVVDRINWNRTKIFTLGSN